MGVHLGFWDHQNHAWQGHFEQSAANLSGTLCPPLWCEVQDNPIVNVLWEIEEAASWIVQVF